MTETVKISSLEGLEKHLKPRLAGERYEEFYEYCEPLGGVTKFVRDESGKVWGCLDDVARLLGITPQEAVERIRAMVQAEQEEKGKVIPLPKKR